MFNTSNSSNSSNSSQSDAGSPSFEFFKENFKRNQLVPLSIIFVVGFLANSTIIFNGIRRRKVIKHYSNYFVLSTAFADWCVIAFNIPVMFVEYLVGLKWMSGLVCQYIFPLREAFQGAAMFSISTLAFLRVYQIVKNPLGQFSQRTSRLLVAGIWLTSVLVCTVPLLDIYRIDDNGLCEPQWPSMLRIKIHLTLVYCIIISPMVVSTIAYGIVIIKVTNFLGADPESVTETRKNRRIAVLLILLILSCWISYTPLAVFIMTSIYTTIHLNVFIWQMAGVFFLAGSALNPVLVLLTMPRDYCFNMQCQRHRRIGIEQPIAMQEVLKSSIPIQDRNRVVQELP